MRIVIMFLLVGVLAGATQSVVAESPFVTGRVLFKPIPGHGAAELEKLLTSVGGLGRKDIGRTGTGILQVPPGLEKRALESLKRSELIEFAELDMRLEPAELIPNDPRYSEAWHLPKIGAATAWEASVGRGIVIAILDSGVDGSHPDLAGRMVPGRNIYGGNNDTTDVNGHGTKVAGTAAATFDNGIGVAGVAGRAGIMPVRITDAQGYGYYSTIAAGLDWAADNGARVANISFQAHGSSSVRSAADRIRAKGGLVAVSAGNDGTRKSFTVSDSLVAVAATNASDGRPSWSNYGTYVDIGGPGTNILTTRRGGGYGKFSGTSFSSPVVAGVAALLLARNPQLTATQLDDILFSTARDLGAAGYDIYYGHGRVDAAAAVAAVDGTEPDVTPPTVGIDSPASGTSVSGSVTVEIIASDDTAVSRVELGVDGALIGTDASSPYRLNWDSTVNPDGVVTLTAWAYDEAGNAALSAAVAVTVANGGSTDSGGTDSGGTDAGGSNGKKIGHNTRGKNK